MPHKRSPRGPKQVALPHTPLGGLLPKTSCAQSFQCLRSVPPLALGHPWRLITIEHWGSACCLSLSSVSTMSSSSSVDKRRMECGWRKELMRIVAQLLAYTPTPTPTPTRLDAADLSFSFAFHAILCAKQAYLFNTG